MRMSRGLYGFAAALLISSSAVAQQQQDFWPLNLRRKRTVLNVDAFFATKPDPAVERQEVLAAAHEDTKMDDMAQLFDVSRHLDMSLSMSMSMGYHPSTPSVPTPSVPSVAPVSAPSSVISPVAVPTTLTAAPIAMPTSAAPVLATSPPALATSAPVATTSSPAGLATEAPAVAMPSSLPLGTPSTSTPTLSVVPILVPSASSTCTTVSRQEAFLQLLQAITPASLLLNPSTPQGLAFQWVFSNDVLTDPCSEPEIATQHYALAVLYFSTNGAGWTTTDDAWLSITASPCAWHGIRCDANGMVTDILLEQNNLTGTIPEEISAIDTLQVVQLFGNSIGGSLPTTLASLSSLKVWDVERNVISGPAFVALPAGLESYRISSNKLAGPIPELTALSELKELWASGNLITGTIPSSMSVLTNLESVFLYENDLVGLLPDFTNLNLERLQLQNNTLAGTVPPSLWSNTRLMDLRLDANQLTGTIPSSIGDLAAVFDLRLANNQFTGVLPAEIARLSTLKFLRVNDNNFVGTIRDAFDAFTQLEYVDFSKNQFTGTLPTSVFDIPTVQILYFYENALTGTIPSNYANSPVLRDLYINDNMLSGQVPSITPDQLPVFTEFRLERNDIFGTIPASICALRGTDNNTDLVTLIADCVSEVECSCCTECL